MFRVSESLLLLCLIALFQLTTPGAGNAQMPGQAAAPAMSGSADDVEARHVAGLPGVKANDKGKLAITAAGLSFSGKSGGAVVPASEIAAVSTGNQRVELWGTKGRLLRMAIPQGGGLVAATFLHHKVNMLTVEFEDAKGGYHAAVFYVAEEAAQKAMEQLALRPVRHERTAERCAAGTLRPNTVRVLMPDWGDEAVPAAYRALVYEKLVDRLLAAKGVTYVYRDGEQDADDQCAAYTVALKATGYKEGSQVARASTGPVGMFVGTTQLKFDARITNARTGTEYRVEAKATVRGETESINVASAVAKKVVKDFGHAQQGVGGPAAAASTL